MPLPAELYGWSGKCLQGLGRQAQYLMGDFLVYHRRHDSSGSGHSAFEPLVANGVPAAFVPK